MTALDRFTWLMTRMFSAPIAVISLVEDGRESFKALSGPSLSGSDFCLYAAETNELFVVEDATKDARFEKSAIVDGPPYVRFYAGVPLRGVKGMVAIMDVQPRRLVGAYREQLEALADMVSDLFTLDALTVQAASQQKLLGAIAHAWPGVIYLYDVKAKQTAYTSRSEAFDLHPDDVHKVGIATSEEPIETSFRLRDTLFSSRELVFSREPDGSVREVLGIASDVAPLHAAERYLRAILDASSEGIAVTDAAGELVWVNPLAERVLDHDASLLERRAEKVEVVLPDGDTFIASLRPLLGGKSALALFRDITDSATDALTGLANRRALSGRLEQLLAEANRGRKFAIVRVALKDFAKINETYGQATGDAALKAMSAALRKVVRKTDFVARSAGQEFCVIYTDVDEQIVPMLAEKLRQLITGACKPLTVHARLGMSAWRRDLTTVDTLLAAAAPLND